MLGYAGGVGKALLNCLLLAALPLNLVVSALLLRCWPHWQTWLWRGCRHRVGTALLEGCVTLVVLLLLVIAALWRWSRQAT